MNGGDQPSLEIERVWLCRGLPEFPSHAERLLIRQGYLQAPDALAVPAQDPDVVPTIGRIRRTQDAAGTVAFVHTIKTGDGLVRREWERPLSAASFDAAWPQTAGRRIFKTRWRVPEGEVVWEIDHFDRLAMVLAEVELPAPDALVEIPAWLAPLLEREVTEDPTYRNVAIAMRSGLLE